MREFSCEQRHPRWAADGSGAEVPLVLSPPVAQMLLDQREVIERIHVQILIVCEDQDDIGRSR